MIAKFRFLLSGAALILSLAACQTTLNETTPQAPNRYEEVDLNGVPLSQVTLPPPSMSTPQPEMVVRSAGMQQQRAALANASREKRIDEGTEPQIAEQATPVPTQEPAQDPDPIPVAAQPPTTADTQPPDGAVAQLGIGGLTAHSLSPDGRYVVLEIHETTYLYEAVTLRRMWQARLNGLVSWMADGQRVAIGSVLYDIASGMPVASLPLDAYRVAWSSDGSLASTQDTYGQMTVWDTATGARLWNMPLGENASAHPGIDSGWVVEMAFSPDGQYISSTAWVQAGCVGGNDPQLHVRNARTGGLVGDFDGAYMWGAALTWSANSKFVAIHSSWDSSDGITVWNVETSEQVIHSERGWNVAWAPSGAQFAYNDGNSVWLHDAETDTEIAQIEMEYGGRLIWSADGTLIAAGSTHNPDITVLNVESGEPVASLEQAGPLVGFGPDDSTIIGGLAMQNSIAVWGLDAPSTTPLAYLHGMTGVNSLAWSPDGSQVISTVGAHYGHRDGVVAWDVASTSAYFSQEGDTYIDWIDGDAEILHTDWSPNGNVVAVSTLGYGDSNDGVIIIDLANRQVLFNIPVTSMQAEFSPDGSMLAVRDTEFITVYSMATYMIVEKYVGEWALMDMAWSPDSTQIAVASAENDYVWVSNNAGMVEVWEVGEEEASYSLGGLEGPALSVAWSPDGTRIAASSNTEAAIWVAGAEKAEPDLMLYSLIERDEWSRMGFTEIDWSPDGSMIAGAYGMPYSRFYCNGCGYGEQGLVMVWDAYTAERLYRFTGHVDEVQTVEFSPDNLLLASGSLDGTILLWDVAR